MKGYRATFRKKNGDLRTMNFIRLPDLPQGFLNEQIKGTGSERKFSKTAELVWDIDSVGFRVINWETMQQEPEVFEAKL